MKRIFNELVQGVLSEMRSESSTNRIAIHPVYQQIIGLGQPAVLLLLREVVKAFWSLVLGFEIH